MADFKRAGIGCPYCGNDLYVDFDICPHCGKEVPASLLQLIQSMHGTSPTPQPQPRPTQPKQPAEQPAQEPVGTKTLSHLEDLEEDSKSKIGTFERLYDEYQSGLKKLGFEDDDYAPLVSLLCSVLEVELSFAIYDKFITYWNILREPYAIELKSHDLCSLGTIEILLRFAAVDGKKCMPNKLKHVWDSAKEHFGEDYGKLHSSIAKFKDIRNDAAHKKTIVKKRFESFFNDYQPFYEEQMPHILALKKYGDSPGYRLFVEYRKNFPSF